MRNQKKHKEIQTERSVAIGITLCSTILIAAAAGLLLAMVHMNRGFGDLVYAMTYIGPPPEEIAESTALEPKDEESADASEPVDETSASGGKTEEEQEQAISDHTLSGNTVSENIVSENIVPENAASGTAVPDYTITDHTVIDNLEQAPAYPQPQQLVDESYFDDALFIGDSRMEGFGLHSGLNATFYAATGLQLHEIDRYKVVRTANGKVPIFSVLQPNQYKKIYIKVGLNELGWGTDELFLQKYAELIARLREMEPGAIIYVHGLIHVTSAKSQTDSTHTNEKINARNAMLQQFAVQQQAYYVDINEVVSDANGALLPDLTSDGIHLKAQYMELWKNYLMAHAVQQ